MTGKNFLIEKPKRRMIAEDVSRINGLFNAYMLGKLFGIGKFSLHCVGQSHEVCAIFFLRDWKMR